jgi:hypothetical protein
MRTIIAGSRTVNEMHVYDAMAACPWRSHITCIISGGAPGADRIGETWADIHDLPCKRYTADWNTHGKKAGPMRNSEMAENADALVAVWDGKSRGTKDMILKAKRRGLRVFVYKIEGCE